MKSALRVFLIVALMSVFAAAQSPNATIAGRVLDPNNALIADAKVDVINLLTSIHSTGQTNREGSFVIPNLPPGPYRIEISKSGFKASVREDVVLRVQDVIALNFTLPVGSVTENVTVTGGTPLVNTEDGTVSTVVDRQFAENLPLNGRSIQTLIMLAPGVVLAPTTSGSQGQFSVNGQRTDTNYYSIDGVSANVGVFAGSGLNQFAGGALPGLAVTGGTNNLVSVDALQEFRIQTSSFAPEFGRSPGGQISIVTRSGTNKFHGALFDYFRNDVLDANDWFADHNGLSKPKERQNDFGGVLGGPIWRDHTFFFFSYEGLRLRQPLAATTAVPSTQSRQTAPAQIQPFLNGFPVPNGPTLAGGFAQFAASYSNPSSLDSYSLRIDHAVSSKVNIFARYNHSPSDTTTRIATSLSSLTKVSSNTDTFTLGVTQAIAPSVSNDFHANYSYVKASTIFQTDTFGGATPAALPFPAAYSPANGLFIFGITGAGSLANGKNATNVQRQVNLVDSLSMTLGIHQLKIGVDYRWLAPFASPLAYQQLAQFSGMTGPTGTLSGVAQVASITALQEDALLARNLSIYGQDTWKVTPRLTLTYGLRWDVNPPLKGKTSSDQPFTVVGLDNPATMSLAPRGTPLYQTTYGNVAPRLGLAYQLSQRRGWESVFRSGAGVFYDLGSGSLGQVTSFFPFGASKTLPAVVFPLTPQQAAPPTLSQVPPVSNLQVTVPNLKLPRTYEWNVAIEQSLGGDQSASITYVGAIGRDLLRNDTLNRPNATFTGGVFVTRNSATSDYHALQLKFERRFARGLQGIASYTFSHSIDIASTDLSNSTPATIANVNVDRGNSDFDVRHSLTAAATYDVPAPGNQWFVRAILGNWALEPFVTARSALPVDLVGPQFIVAGTRFQARPNIVPNVPFYLFGTQYPGGKAFNKAAFVNPATGTQGDLGRNTLRGFGAWQANLALRRRFPITETVGLQFRAEFFNIFNHPNFGAPTNTLSSPLFGQSTQMLGPSLGAGGATGGFNPLYQIGGPRSVQLALKLQF